LSKDFPVVVNWPRFKRSWVGYGEVVLDGFIFFGKRDSALDKMNDDGKEGALYIQIPGFLCSIIRI
jgi:hypothetical protein